MPERKTRQPWRLGDSAESQAGGGAISVVFLLTHQLLRMSLKNYTSYLLYRFLPLHWPFVILWDFFFSFKKFKCIINILLYYLKC